MAWIDNEPLKGRGGKNDDIAEQVRISFRKQKNSNYPSLTIQIGENIVKKEGLKEGDKVFFKIDDRNPRKWLIKKTDSSYEGYTLSRPNKKSMSKYFMVQVTFHKVKIDLKDEDYRLKKAKHDFDHGGVVIFGD